MSLAPEPAVAGQDDGTSTAAVPRPLSQRYDVALLDLDGVVYRGPDPIAGAAEALALARRTGMRFAFVTNNASRSSEDVAAHLAALGVPAGPEEVVTSAQAAATLSVQRFGAGRRVLVVGSDSLRAAVTAVGQQLVERYDAVPPPEIVVQGFSPDLCYEDLATASFAVAAGAHWVATNTDATLPTSRGIQPGNGTLVAAVAAASGQRPLVAGKPERALVDEAVKRSGATRPLMVGDRMDTDIEGAVRTGMDSLLVLTGISTVEDLLKAGKESRPTYLAADLSGLGAALTALDQLGPGDWHREAHPDGVWLTRRAELGDPLHALRTLVVAAWEVVDAGERVTGIMVEGDQAPMLTELGVPAALLRAAAEPASARSSTDDGAAQAGDRHGQH